MRRLTLVAFASAGLLVSTMGRAACALPRAQPAVKMAASEWLAQLSPKLRGALEGRGFAFPEAGFIEECPEMVPALLVIDRPADRVFELLRQTERHVEFMDAIGSITPVSRRPEDHIDRYEMRFMFSRITYFVRHDWDAESRRIWWSLSSDHANDLRGVEGFWEIHALDDRRSIAIYASAIDVGPVIPKRLQRTLTRRNLRAIVGSARIWLASDGGIEP